MSEVDSPVLRLIPFLAAFTVAVFLGLPAMGNGDLLAAVVVAAVAYFVTYYLVRYIIGLIVRNRRNSTDDQD
ncbi:hypothetical protein CXR25_04165 [Brevibacterium aurantiacum]|uniref:hypothetical protein n=1 Tax=Brevibacterium aurantiacum TaxID=273384 RepID=UPI000F647B32|nr:hypothetical protein [Brevibacterium aurantiacum]AZL12098.1 hypothetical protein CXR25_04165 [Brevibacterium aurantiacum]